MTRSKTLPLLRTHWADLAKCAGHDTDMYDMGARKVATPQQRHQIAATLCKGCPVMRECAADALEHNDTHYVRAGVFLPASDKTSAEARAKLRRIVNGGTTR